VAAPGSGPAPVWHSSGVTGLEHAARDIALSAAAGVNAEISWRRRPTGLS